MTDPTDTGLPDDSSDDRQRERRRGELRRVERALRHGAVALLVAILALGAGLTALWRSIDAERTLETRLGAALEGRDRAIADAAVARTRDPSAAAAASLEPLVTRLGGLDGRLDRVEARLDAPERAVARAETAHLVDLASRRLALEHDIAGAVTLFAAAEARLAAQADPAALRIRAQLARDLAALRAAQAPDLHAIAARLGVAEAAVRELPMLGAIHDAYVAPGGEPSAASGAARAWRQFTTSLADLVSVRRVSDASVRLVSVEEIGVRRRHLQTLLFAARLAALRADAAEFAADIREARDWVGRYFDASDARTRALAAELDALGTERVAAEIPDVSGSLRLLRGPSP
jgi:uroporphyrin-3 C-methyltransferase